MVANLGAAESFAPAHMPLLVVKVGSALLVEPTGDVRREWLAALVDELAARVAAGQRIVIVSSGAIALGARRLGLEKGGRANLADAQAAASVGQIALAGIWSDLLAARGLTAAQMLLTLDDFEDRRRYLNAAATLSRLLEAGAVPVINENDSVATSEIRFGDNDRLAARVAQAAGAQGVVLLSDIDGLYDRNPAEEGAVHLPEIRELTDDVRAMADGSSASGMGSGGMAVKLEAGAVPVINENDSVATSEIRFGDNDRLAARVAQAAGAQGVVLLSDIDGLYDRNPAEEGAVHLPEIRELTDDVRAMADGSSASGMGTGGMAVKLEAARIACLAGIPLAIISGKVTAPLTAWEDGARGTLFHPQRQENARKSWLGARQSAAGSVTVDAGAVGALGRGSSLLPAGVTAVEGQFARGDAVDVLDPDGVAIARGLAEYDAAEARAIMGRRKDEVAAILGYAPRRALIHRDQLVLL